jgi:acyl-[acyl-carrier-protein]-phospholipid O-acyltransferase/long-chain-fatty-acid--[acyl-carrier-protein] ligase
MPLTNHHRLTHEPVPAGDVRSAALPELAHDPSFWGMTATQFLGAFNDNLFKQLVLLLCLDLARAAGGGDPYQPIAMAVFSIPFVLFSGLAGHLADRNSKRWIVVASKVAEIGIMLLGMLAFGLHSVVALFVVLCFMGAQSAFFGPSKYGILPEMLRLRDLPQANGIFLMTTFLAIIFGQAGAGYLKELLPERLWVVSGTCVFVAVAGTLTALWVRPTPVAHPGLPFRWSALAIPGETWQLLRRDRLLFRVILVSSLFWFLGGVVQPAVNAFGKLELEVGDLRTSLLLVCVGVGIAAGCALAGKLSARRVSFGLFKLGAWGMVGCLLLLAGLGRAQEPTPWLEWQCRVVLTLLGVSAGFFSVPLQVFVQTRAPQDQKGRVLGTLNLVNWIGIFLSAGFYGVLAVVFESLKVPPSAMFAATALLLLPVALFFRPGRAERV